MVLALPRGGVPVGLEIAIELGLPLVRSANTGISAVIDPVGRTVASLGLGIEDILDANLPTAIPPTLYARVGDIPAAMLVALAVLLAVRRRIAKRPPRSRRPVDTAGIL